MRKLIVMALLLVGSSSLFAQKSVDKAMGYLKEDKIDEARTEIDKASTDPKAGGNADYWFTRARIYAIISKQATDTAAARQALIAMQQYVNIQAGVKDESRQYLSSILESHQTAAGIYNSYLNAGIKNLQGKQFQLAEYHFANALEAFDYLKKAKIISQTFDTTATLYAGYAAESYDNKDAAVRYYVQIADRRMPDTTMIGVYQYLVRYYSDKKDIANKDKYTKIGKELFPKDPWWDAWELQSVKGDKPTKIATYKEMFQRDPRNMDVAETYVVELFNYTYKDVPADASKRQEELTAALDIIVGNNPSDVRWNHIYTQHLTYRTGDLETAAKAVKGTKPEDVKRKADANKAVASAYEAMLAQALKTAALYDAKTDMTPSDKANYKFVINSIVAAYQYKKNDAEATKWDNKSKAIK
ncbi:MAG: hypothetical protein EOO08_05545 [Chitinophagaceae bacterium]|nr:MAG: hypothetical protein EOO08_05545 [Chitinophagaceae bacterium]